MNTIHPHRLRRYALGLLSGCLLLSACSEDEPENNPVSAVEPDFAILTTTLVLGGGGSDGANYLMTVNDLEEPATQSNATGIELPVFSAIRTYQGDVYHYGDALLSKFVLDEEGQLQPSGSLDFGAYGGLIGDVEFLSPSKAYAAVRSAIVEFNPSTMSLGEVIDISSTEGLEPFQDLTISASEIITRGDELYASLFIFNAEFTPDDTPDSVMVVSMNTNTNEILGLSVKPGAATGGDNYGAEGMFLDENNDIYIQAHGFWDADMGLPTALVRIPSGSRQFDDYFWDLTQACGGRKTLHAFYGGGSTAFTKAYYPDAGSYWSVGSHKWWKLDFASQTAVEMAVPGFNSGYWSPVALRDGDKFYFPMTDVSTNVVYEYDASLGDADDPATIRSVLTLEQGRLNGIEKFD
ncbi:MAG: hypothetical protein AAF944_19195 [Bacteroidota bacterium]